MIAQATRLETTTITEKLTGLCGGFATVFSQKRTANRATILLIAALLCVGRKWITRLNCVREREQVDWSADYKLFSRSKWKACDLFIPAITESISWFPDGPIFLAGDETTVKRSGRKVKRSAWTRDPMSPPFQVNLIKGIRFIQFSALLPLHETHNVGARSIPVSFEPVDRLKKPNSKASDEERAIYTQFCKKNSMCHQTVKQLDALRLLFDNAGARLRNLLLALDGSFSNRTMFGAKLDRIFLIARSRKDAVLCFPANDPDHPSRVYSKDKFTPDQIRQNDSIPWSIANIFFGGKKRDIRFKEISNVLWQGGAKRKPLRLIVVAPTTYKLSPGMRNYYRDPAYLLADDLNSPILTLLQCYFDRWQIEVNHREEKQHIGIADAQVWNDRSVDKVPAFMVAAYSLLLLVSLKAFGPTRTQDYLPPPRWQRKTNARPSCIDMISKLRQEVISSPEKFPSEFKPHLDHITLRAA